MPHGILLSISSPSTTPSQV